MTATTITLADSHLATLLAGYRSPAELIYGEDYTPGMVAVRNEAHRLGLEVTELDGNGFAVAINGEVILEGWSFRHTTGHQAEQWIAFDEAQPDGYRLSAAAGAGYHVRCHAALR